MEKQVLLIFAAANRYLDNVPVAACRKYEMDLYTFVETNYGGLLKSIREKKALDDSVKAELTKALDAFKESFQAAPEAVAVAKVNRPRVQVTRKTFDAYATRLPAERIRSVKSTQQIHASDEIRFRSKVRRAQEGAGCGADAVPRKSASATLGCQRAWSQRRTRFSIAGQRNGFLVAGAHGRPQPCAGAFNANVDPARDAFLRGELVEEDSGVCHR